MEYFKIFSPAIVSEVEGNDELIKLCDELNSNYKEKYNDLNYYFFKNSEDSNEYNYERFVVNKFAVETILKSNCAGHLIKNELIGRFSPTEH